MLGKIEGRRRRGQQRRGLDCITDSMDTNKLWVMAKDREAWRAALHGIAKSRTIRTNFQSRGTQSLLMLFAASR